MSKQSLMSRGLTLIELMVAIAILAILAVAAIPAFNDYIDRQRVRGAAESLFTDLAFARTDAVRRNANVFLNFTTGAGSCYSLGENDTCGCSCSIKAVSAADFSAAFTNVRIDSVSSSSGLMSGFSLTKERGTSSVLDVITIVVKSSTTGRQINVSLSPLGIPGICTPTQNVAGISNC